MSVSTVGTLIETGGFVGYKISVAVTGGDTEGTVDGVPTASKDSNGYYAFDLERELDTGDS